MLLLLPRTPCQLDPTESGRLKGLELPSTQYFEDDCNQRLVVSLEERAEELAALRTPQRVRLALRARLEMLIPFMGAPHGACSALAYP